MNVAKKLDGRKCRSITKQKISITVSQENFEKLNELEVNKSKFINWLLLNYYKSEEGDKNV